MAEEPKRVVTSSGKVIETETELLQKKIEKRREEAAIADANAAVAEEIQKKEEEVKKEYIFPPTTLLKKGARSSRQYFRKRVPGNGGKAPADPAQFRCWSDGHQYQLRPCRDKV